MLPEEADEGTGTLQEEEAGEEARDPGVLWAKEKERSERASRPNPLFTGPEWR
jgi:hypothetical protein